MRIRTGIRPGDWLDVGPARAWYVGGPLSLAGLGHHTRAIVTQEGERRLSVAVLPIARAKGHASLGSDA